jgi:hypothetical protein
MCMDATQPGNHPVEELSEKVTPVAELSDEALDGILTNLPLDALLRPAASDRGRAGQGPKPKI